MPFPQIPAGLLKNPDRKAAFQDIKSWMLQELQAPTVQVDDAIPSGATSVDEALGGGYIPGRITEIVEPSPSRGVQSLIHGAIRQARENLQFVALIDAHNQFDPQSETTETLQSLLWVRTTRSEDVVKACDILIRDGNFSLLLLDMRMQSNQRRAFIRPNEWYRLQRVCEQSRIACVAFTGQSTIPCAHFRLQLSQTLPIHILDQPQFTALPHIECDVLKRRITDDASFASRSEEQMPLKVANASF